MNLETGIYEYAKQGLVLSADKTALWFYGNTITYRELFLKIDNTADHLYAIGVREGTVVTIHLPNCPQAVIAIYAVAKLGAICNMAHSQMPAAALRKNMDFTDSSVLITYKADCLETADTALYVDIAHHMAPEYKEVFRNQLDTSCPEGVQAFEDFELECSEKAVIPDQTALADKCAVYFNSSGTTGEPKTVMHRHGALNHSATNAWEPDWTDDIKDVVLLNVLPMYHGSGFALDIHLIISSGAKMIQLIKWDCELAAQLIDAFKVTTMCVVPQIIVALLNNPNFTGEFLSKMFVGGDILPYELKKAYYKRTGHYLLEGYGMTEIVSTCAVVPPDTNDLESGMIPYRDFEVAVLNSYGNLMKQGEGELMISSKTIMLGYLHDKEATEAVKTVFDGKVWIRTGDYGKIDEEGKIFVIDRIKRIIIHNGYNVYPKEVEAIIDALPEVMEVCVFGANDPETKTQTVCACVVPTEGTDEGMVKSRIDSECLKFLPYYAVPRRIVFTDKLPRNAMNKVCLEKMEDFLL